MTTSSAAIPSKKIFYIDHVKVLLTVLVVLHHAFVTYGAPGGWYYKEPATGLQALVPMTMFVAVNQSFFMQLFFLLSAYFMEASYERKGASKFLADRFKRLGIPLIFYSFILSPVLNFLVYRYGYKKNATFFQFLGGYDNWVDFGVLWFVAALLIFTLIFILYKKINTNAYSAGSIKLPKPFTIFIFSAVLGLISFLIRLQFPIGKVLAPPGFQFAHFTQYIALFYIGIISKRNNWLEQLTFNYAKRFGILALVMIIIVFPSMFVLKGIYNSPLENFSGGWRWEALMNSLWEQITGVSIITFLLSYSKFKWNKYSLRLNKLSRAAFAVYIFHPLFLISLSLILSAIHISPVLKLLIVGPLAVISIFSFALIVVKIKGVNQVI